VSIATLAADIINGVLLEQGVEVRVRRLLRAMQAEAFAAAAAAAALGYPRVLQGAVA